MAMTDAELQAWIDAQVEEAIEADKDEISEYLESDELDKALEEDFAEREAEVAKMEKAEADKKNAQ